MEFLLVHFSSPRAVQVDGKTLGRTEELIVLEPGTYRVTLAPPRNFNPIQHVVQLPASLNPCEVSFDAVAGLMYAQEQDTPPEAAPAPGPTEAAVTMRALEKSTEKSKEWRVREPGEDEVWELTSALQQRRRWGDVPVTAARMARRCLEIMAMLGVSDTMLREMANARAIEIDFTPNQSIGMQFPWEFVIAESTRAHRHSGGVRRSLLITRHLEAGQSVPIPEPDSVLVIESAPGDLAEHYSFSSERSVVLSSLNMSRSLPLENPDVNVIRQAITTLQPSVVHFTGVDGYQGAELLRLDPPEADGVYVREESGLRTAPFAEMAELLTSGPRKPALVVLNLYNSSTLAAKLVEQGAHAAIGFQDSIDDAVAELFFAALYAAWRPTSWDLLDAFDAAWRRVATHARELRGTGILLWSRRSFRKPAKWDRPMPAAGPEIATPKQRARRRRSLSTPGRAQKAAGAPSVPPSLPVAAPAPAAAVTIDYKAPDKLNYSLLHNNLPLFPEFMLRCAGPGTFTVSVDVALNAGVETARYEASFILSQTNNAINLASPDNKNSIRVSLTSELARSLAESVYTSVVVHVRNNGQTLRQQTHRVELLAIDEWKDDDLNRQWLPSFVFPRDAAVRRIVDAAQRYLVALADDSGAGFDGYQSYDPEGGSLEERARGIDFQVQALWWTIISDFNLAYINPPPTFTDKSQRLRTPSDIVTGKRGTCIDLTLLLAACLEYVEIYPTIFLLRDHAFPGYVRSEESHVLIRDHFTTTAAPGSATGPRSERSTAQFGWVLPSSRFTDVMKLVQAGHIVPVETVALTQRTGFDAAIEEGLQNLRDRRSFESLFDLRLAREAGVTPLPIWSTRV